MGGYEIAGPFDPPSALERYLFEAAGVPEPRVCFLGTASGDQPDTIARFYEVAEALPCRPTHLALFHDRDVEDLDAFLDVCDVVYVAGGNTASMLAVWRAHGLDRALAVRAAARDFVVGGASAGGMCWFDAGFTMSFGPLTPLHDGLGWFPGSFNPHAQQSDRLDAYCAAVADGSVPAGWAVDDGAALHYVDGRLARVVRASSDARVHAVSESGAEAVDSELIV
ncbi:MAG: dipeptidase [Actinomycetota bacterium]|nr:dipeptidase [Actinomycetota bacterium]